MITRVGCKAARWRYFVGLAGVMTGMLWARSSRGAMIYVSNGGNGTIQAVSLTGVVSTYATGLSTPRGLAFDAANNLYVANNGDQTIRKITPQGVMTTFASGLTGDLYGVAVDQSTGNVFVSEILNDTSNSLILKFTPGGIMTTFATLAAPGGLVFDTNHNLFVTLASGGGAAGAVGGINEVSPAGVVTPVVSTGMSDPVGLARSASGDLYAAELNGDMRILHSTTGGAVNVFATGVGTPYGLTFGPDGTLYVADFAGGDLEAVTSGGGVSTFATGFSSPRFITLGPDAVPEPGTLGLLVLGGAALLARRRRG